MAFNLSQFKDIFYQKYRRQPFDGEIALAGQLSDTYPNADVNALISATANNWSGQLGDPNKILSFIVALRIQGFCAQYAILPETMTRPRWR